MKSIINEKPFKSILLFALPLLIANLLTQSYNIIDLIIAGNKIGSDALGATGCTSTLIQFLSSLFWGFGVAFSTVVGEMFGAGKKQEIARVIKTVTIFITALSAIMCLVCALLAEQILTWLRVDSLIFNDAVLYFRIFMIALFFQAASYQVLSFLHGLGDSKFPMIVTSITGLFNLGLNLLFVVQFKWGVSGLAWATVISSGIGLVLSIIKYFIVIKQLDSKPNFEFNFDDLKVVSKLAIPCIIQQCSLYLSSVVVQPYINGMGSSYSAGYSIAMNISLIYNAFYHALSRAVATYASQSKGAKKYENFKKGILNGLLIQIMFIVPLMVLSFIFPTQIASIFVKEGQEDCVPYVVTFIYYCAPFLFFICYSNLMHSFYKSVEATKTVMISTIAFTAVRILLTYTLPEDGKLSSVYFGLAGAWVFEALLQFIFYLIGKWKSKEQLEFERNQVNQ